jgi:phage tail-like protein
MPRKDPLRNFQFRLEIDGIQQAGFSEVAIGETTIDAIDYREGNEPTRVRKVSGLTKYGNITQKNGVTHSLELFNWHKKTVDGQVASNRKKVIIVVVDEAGSDTARLVASEA